MEDLMDIKQAAEFLTVKESWIRSAIYKKKIKHIKLGGLIRISKTHLKELIQDSTRATKNMNS